MAMPLLFAALTVLAHPAIADDAAAPEYVKDVAPIFKTYCAGCHNDEDREGKFSLESYASLQKGTAKGPAILPGDPQGSRIVRVLTGLAKPAMPPKDEPRPSDADIKRIALWIEAGAKGPEGKAPDRLTLITPKIASRAKERPITAIDISREGLVVIARGAETGLYDPGDPLDKAPRRTLGPFPGKVNAVHFTPDGLRVVVATGVAGLGGVAEIRTVGDGKLERRFEGLRDILYDAELSPDGKVLAACGYDKSIILWDAATAKPLAALEGHTGAVFDIAFSPDGRVLVSASADDTCKVWRVADGARLDTLPQPLKAEYACAFSPDGGSIVAAGADNNLRVWTFVSRDKPAINPPALARFAHEGAIVKLAYSPDGGKLVTLAEDRTVKVWRARDFVELKAWENEPDIASALAFRPDGALVVGRLDGSISTYELPSESAASPEHDAPRPIAIAMPAKDPVDQGAEREPNNAPAEANRLELPGRITGAIDGGPGADKRDTDHFRFQAKAGEQWVFEINAARASSKLDSFIEVLDSQGARVPRVLLQAERDSYFTFRGKSDAGSDDFRLFNWEEMGLDEYLYANGEVVKLWLHPRGPDSGFMTYPGQGNRWGWFDTTPLAHALGEPCYIVSPHPPGSKLVPNGLPVFTIFYENDDDAHRELGKDSRLFFTAPAAGEYTLKLKDVRGLGGPDFKYTLTARARRPDFTVSLSGADPTVAAGSGKEFKLSAHRLDGFEGAIRVDITNIPEGFHVTSPIVIEPGQIEALGVITADADAKPPSPEAAKTTAVKASAGIDGAEISHDVNNLGTIKLAPAPKLRVTIVPSADGPKPTQADPGAPPAFEIAPGGTITLTVKLERNGYNGQAPFGNEGSGRNLPYGVIVDNLGLNGLLALEGQTERTFFVTADKVAAEQTRPFHLTTSAEGGQSSPPVYLRVKKPAPAH